MAVTLVNPYGWNTLLAPISRYTVEYPAFREYYANPKGFPQFQYYPLTGKFWSGGVGAAEIAGLILLATAPVTFVLNFRRLDFGHVTLWLGFCLFSVAALHELAAAALVSAVLATLNAQEWYQNTFRQTYSVESSELLFSRGGRAATVLALFGLAYLSISGLLERRTGIGFNRNLEASFEGLGEQLEDSYDNRPFNFVLAQGDLLIWVDQKAFVDSRVGLYARRGEEDLLKLHRETRDALRAANKKGEEGKKWKPALDRFKITHVLPRLETRLGREFIDYDTMKNLFASKDWQLCSFGATTVVYYRNDLSDPKLAAYLKTHRYDFDSAFRKSSRPPEKRVLWARGPNVYEQWLSRPRKFRPNAVEVARHYAQLFGNVPTPQGQMIMAHLVIRNANNGLAYRMTGLFGEELVPRSADGYRVLGRAYFVLAKAERAFVTAAVEDRSRSEQYRDQAAFSRYLIETRRYRQSVAAFQQALVIDPDNYEILFELGFVQNEFGRYDLATPHLERAIELLDRSDPDPEDERPKMWRQKLTEAKQRRNDAYEKVDKEQRTAQRLGDRDQNRFAHVQRATRHRCSKLALEILDEDPEFVNKHISIAVQRIILLQEAGRIEEADESLQQIAGLYKERAKPFEIQDLEATVEVCRADYAAARKVWQEFAELRERQRQDQLLLSFPIAVREPAGVALRYQRQEVPWSMEQMFSLRDAFGRDTGVITDYLFAAAQTHLESGNIAGAVELLEKIGDISPDAPLRHLVNAYLLIARGKGLPPIPKAKSDPAKKTPKQPGTKKKPVIKTDKTTPGGGTKPGQ